MPQTKTPLRYPGGKSQLIPFVRHTINLNNLKDVVYCEPFSGGAGVAIDQLLNRESATIILNDYDIAIYSFWYAVFNETDKLISTIEKTPVTISMWMEMHKIYQTLSCLNEYNFELAFSTFFLNRTNRSGIITGGPIGGLNDKNSYQISCRFNKPNLINKIQLIATQHHRVRLYHMDAIDLIRTVLIDQPKEQLFVFLIRLIINKEKNYIKMLLMMINICN